MLFCHLRAVHILRSWTTYLDTDLCEVRSLETHEGKRVCPDETFLFKVRGYIGFLFKTKNKFCCYLKEDITEENNFAFSFEDNHMAFVRCLCLFNMSARFALLGQCRLPYNILSHLVWRVITLYWVRKTVAWWDCAIMSFPLFSVCWVGLCCHVLPIIFHKHSSTVNLAAQLMIELKIWCTK